MRVLIFLFCASLWAQEKGWMLEGTAVGSPVHVGAGLNLGVAAPYGFSLIAPVSFSFGLSHPGLIKWAVGFGGRYFFKKEAFDPGVYLQAWLELGFERFKQVQFATVAPSLLLGYGFALGPHWTLQMGLGTQLIVPASPNVYPSKGLVGLLPVLQLGVSYAFF